MNGTPEAIERAQREVARAKGELQSTLGTLQYRLKPGNLMSDAWEGVREKSGEMAGGAIRTVKERPIATSGILAAVVVFLAREPLWRVASSFLSRDEEEQAGVIEADLDRHDKDYDLTAPTVKKSKKEGVTV
jgi:hypothetical protein